MPPGFPPSYTDTDLSTLLTFQDRTLEQRSPTAGPIAMTSTMWQVSDLVAWLQYRVNRFLRETGLVVARWGYDGIAQDRSIKTTPQIESVQLPQNMVDMLRMAFVNYTTTVPATPNNVTEVPREDFMMLDANDATWETTPNPTPTAYTQSVTETLQAFLSHPPSGVGAVDVTFVATGPTLTGNGVPLPLPSIVAQYALYGCLADALAQEGEANNPQLAEYCEMRFGEGIVLAKSLLTAPARAEAGQM